MNPPEVEFTISQVKPIKVCPLLKQDRGNGHEGRLIEPYDDRAINRESASCERRATWRGKQAVLHESQDLELFTQLAAVSTGNCSWGPLINLSIPGRRVIQGNGRYSAQYVVGPITVRQVGRQPLPKRVCESTLRSE